MANTRALFSRNAHGTGLQKPSKKPYMYNKQLINLERSVFTGKSQTSALPYSGLLTGCDKKTEITRYFRGRLRDKNGLLCDKLCKLCDFFLSYFEHILLGFRGRKPLWGCSKDKLNIKGQKLNIYG